MFIVQTRKKGKIVIGDIDEKNTYEIGDLFAVYTGEKAEDLVQNQAPVAVFKTRKEAQDYIDKQATVQVDSENAQIAELKRKLAEAEAKIAKAGK